MPLANQLTYLLHDFDLTWIAARDGKQISIVPIQRPVTIRRQHREAALAAVPSGTVMPEQIHPTPSQGLVSVEATVETHELIAGRPQARTDASQRRAKSRQQTRQVFTLRVREQPVGTILKHVAQQTGLEFDVAKLSESELSQLTKRVSFEVTNASLDELLQAICKPASLRATRRNGVLTIDSLGTGTK